jgi:hypothetical protein
MQHTENILYIVFVKKTQASQLITIKDNKPCAYILKICKKTGQSKKKIKDGSPKPTWLLAQTSNWFCQSCMHMHDILVG